jgi:hypothetical protein
MTANTKSSRVRWVIPSLTVVLFMLAGQLPAQPEKGGNAVPEFDDVSEMEVHLHFLTDPLGDEPHQRQRERSIQYLLDHANESYPRLVAALAANPTALNASAIIDILPLFRRAETVPLLTDIMLSGVEGLSEAAGKALGRHPDPAARAALIAGLGSDLPESVSAAADGLMVRADRSVCSELKASLQIREPIARSHVFQAASRLGCLTQEEMDAFGHAYPELRIQRPAKK